MNRETPIILVPEWEANRQTQDLREKVKFYMLICWALFVINLFATLMVFLCR